MSDERPAAVHAEPTLGTLLQRLVADTGHLIRTELRLARSEVVSGLRGAAAGAAMIGISIILMLGAVFTFLGALVGWLTPLLGAGWAAAAVAVGTAVVAAVLAAIGIGKLNPQRLVPTQAAASVRRDVDSLQGN